ncbi:MAG: outer membrane translocation and assembly module TamA, partial [Cocleimonas sp.]
WRSPVGPVRIDLGFPTDDFSKPKLHLSIGSDL